MDRSSYFIKDKALFGSYPTQNAISELENEGVRYFIDLTYPNEKRITPYKTTHNYISFPIKDRSYPENCIDFSKFIHNLAEIILSLKGNDKVYIHCKGGHGRSGVVVAILVCKIFNFTPEESLEHTTNSHNNREVMRDKWRKIGSPQTYQQKNFVYNFCKPLQFCKATKSGKTAGFSNFSNHSVNIPNKGLFPTAEAAFQSFKSDDINYINKQINSISPNFSKLLGNKVIVNKDWWCKAPEILFQILKLKFDQHKELVENLLKSGISPIVYHTKLDNILGDGYNNGTNILGKCLVKLRSYYLTKN
jgi:ribA/ribD-fused uncharacterized protein